MITYVPKSRSLETGNDYIGACPYAFLIHALALHTHTPVEWETDATIPDSPRCRGGSKHDPRPG